MGARSRIATAVAAAVLVLLAACGTTSPEVEPVVVQADDLNGAVVEVALDSSIIVQTGRLGIESYTAEIEDESVAAFVEGADTGDVGYYPAFTPQKVGETAVTMTSDRAGVPTIGFTIRVLPAPTG